MHVPRLLRLLTTLTVAGLPLAGCSGSQSALAPAGMEAERVAELFWIMLAGAAVIWLLVLGTAFYASRIRPHRHSTVLGRRLIGWGGVVLPTLVLAALLGYGLTLMTDFRAPAGDLRVEVSGEQWWWRVRYHPPHAEEPVTVANEIRLPLGERVEFILSSPDVIHSFWIPSLGGKVDMIPGRENRLVLEPTRTGEFRGVCAEFCGDSHALMAFAVVVMEPADFEAWLAEQAKPARAPSGALGEQGQALFQAVGCAGCHAIRGTGARGSIGPDLTHLAARRSLGAGILPNDRSALRRFIAATTEVKPGSKMPAFGMLPDEHLDAIVAYLGGLE
jgi:cytochrome c oxidase subunit 2